MNKEYQATWTKICERFNEANFLQSPRWADMNEKIGHKVIIEHFEDVAWCLMIVKNAKRGRYIEIPGGPLMDWTDEEIVRRMFNCIRLAAKRNKCVFIRFRPMVPRYKYGQIKELNKKLKLGFREAPMHLAAEHTVMIDLTRPEDELLANMRRQTRYEVRRADKLGIKVEYADTEEIYREFHSVQTETAKRKGFIPPDLATLLAERKSFADQARLYVARTSDKEPIAYGLILWDGVEAAYYEAASTELNYSLPGAYALLWQVMRDLKKLGLKRFNLYGTAPIVDGKPEPGHRYAGVTTFKMGFAGVIKEFVPAQDIAIKRCHYALDRAIELARKKKRHL